MLWDESFESWIELGVSSQPTAILLTPDGTIITGDAEFCQRAICRVIRDGSSYYLFTVKANQPALMAYLAVAFGDAFPPGVGQGAGRHAAAAGLGNPAA